MIHQTLKCHTINMYLASPTCRTLMARTCPMTGPPTALLTCRTSRMRTCLRTGSLSAMGHPPTTPMMLPLTMLTATPLAPQQSTHDLYLLFHDPETNDGCTSEPVMSAIQTISHTPTNTDADTDADDNYDDYDNIPLNLSLLFHVHGPNNVYKTKPVPPDISRPPSDSENSGSDSNNENITTATVQLQGLTVEKVNPASHDNLLPTQPSAEVEN